MPNVNVSYQEMQFQAAKLRAEHQETSSRLHSMQSDIEGLVSTGFVTDSASGQFAAAYDTFNRGAQQALEGLEAMATYLDQAANAFETVDTELALRLG
jgi:WXG100 family type VII secretion target